MFKTTTFGDPRLLWLGAAALAAGALLWGCNEAGQPKAAPPAAPAAVVASQNVTAAPARPTAEVRRETLRRCAPAVGSFRARQTTKLGPQVSGRVQQVLVDVGDLVKQGQVLVRLDPTFFEIDVQQNKAAVEASEGALASLAVDVANAEREMKRQLDLFEQGAGSTKERDDAVTAYDRAVANRAEKAGRLAEAQKRLEYVQQQLEETQIRAPYDGAITARMVDPGESATMMPPTQLVAIQEIGVLYLEFALPQELLGSVSVGAPLQFEVEGVPDGAATGTVAVIFPAVDEMTRSFYCRAVIENPRRKYQPGLLARVNVVLQEVKDALVVPRTALSQTASGWQALVAADDGPPVVTPVEVGLMTDDWAQVLKGLTEGDRVIAAANGRS
jgi:RND family efflux transporter MFP subunit